MINLVVDSEINIPFPSKINYHQNVIIDFSSKAPSEWSEYLNSIRDTEHYFIEASSLIISEIKLPEHMKVTFFGYYFSQHQGVVEIPSPPNHEIENIFSAINLKTFFHPFGELVLPRVVGHILFEAIHTMNEKTASAHDIDKAMTFGTNYPLPISQWIHQIPKSVLFSLHHKLTQISVPPAPMEF